MQGQYASTSQAIQIGFLAAAAQEKQVSHQAVDIKTYDSSNKNIERLYQLAVSEHADFIVGPLSKAEVTSLAASTAHLPILALNTLDKNNQNTPASFFQFGLSPKDEIKQLTDRAWQNGHRHAMIISAKDEWGRGLQKNFKSAWGSLGGTVTAELGFSRDDIDFFNPIQEQLVDKKVVPDKKTRIPPARHDIDIIFLASFPKQARQIHPAINFFYAGSVPVYGMSSLYSGASDPQRDQDLNGIYFVEMPWILNPLALPQALPEIYQAIHAEFPLSSGFQNKFYA